ncbi:GNAT family N-acetyltransferase [Amnibacterium endophyticum]|uniref:GNAT family N-acetyltransferase n=1 Tax=Amnibacterium endophyticum TaxID=2109337 RepID=A0ABW4LLI9_9MICO
MRTRLLSIDDAAEHAAALAAERDFLAPYEPMRSDAFYTAAGQREVLRLRLERYEAGVEVPRAILDDDGAIVGGITLQTIERGPFLSCGVGYWVARAANGRGFASAAVAEVLDLAFGDLGLHRVQAVTLLDNARSQRVLGKNGFERIGTAPKYLKLAGEWKDHHLFQRLAPV